MVELVSDNAAASLSCRALARRVDALVLAYRFEATERFLSAVGESRALADLAGSAVLSVAGMKFALRRSRRLLSFPFENADLRAVFDPMATGGWCLEVVLRASFLATHELGVAIGLADRLARGIGPSDGRRLRRFDCAADYVGFPLSPGDIELIVTTRARRQSFLVESKDLDEVGGELCRPRITEHRRSALQVTGITVAPGNTQMARIYDKSTELALPGRELKREIERALWRKAGWDGQSGVTRVEFQHRGVFLDEIGLRDPSALEAALDSVWQRDTRWLRMAKAATTSRAYRAPLHERWEAVRATVFSHVAEPIERSRAHRGGASPEHVLGTTVSRLASSLQLRPLEFEVTEHGEVLDKDSFETMSVDEATAWIDEVSARLFDAAGRDAARNLLRRHGPRTAALRLFSKLNAATARFSSVDDEEVSS